MGTTLSLLLFAVFIIVILALGAGIIWFIMWMRHQDALKWQKEAAKLGLEFIKGPIFTLQGSYGGVPVRIERHRKRRHSASSGRRYRIYSDLYMKLQSPYPSGLHISREGVGTKLVKLVGAEDIEVGHARFDRAIRVRANHAEEARAYLGRSGVIDAFGAIYSATGEFELRNGAIRLRYSGVRFGQELRDLLDSMTQQARIIDGQNQSW